jgi:ABC-type lipoprotein release transport system permease subunit
LAAITLGHALVASVRHRSHDLAVLKTVGYVRSQVSAAVLWQATTVAAAAMVVGLPVGVVAGRLLWRLFAHQIGVATDPVTPLATVAVAVICTLTVANAVAAIPGRSAARLRPASLLRSE